jgi:hypothetical protein
MRAARKEAERQRKHREQVLKELAAEVDGLGTPRGPSHSKRVCDLRASGHYGRYLRRLSTSFAKFVRNTLPTC